MIHVSTVGHCQQTLNKLVKVLRVYFLKSTGSEVPTVEEKLVRVCVCLSGLNLCAFVKTKPRLYSVLHSVTVLHTPLYLVQMSYKVEDVPSSSSSPKHCYLFSSSTELTFHHCNLLSKARGHAALLFCYCLSRGWRHESW